MIEKLAPLPFLVPVALAVFRPGRRLDYRWGGVIASLVLLWINFGRISTAGFVWSVLGFPSVTTTFLVFDASLRCFDGKGLLSESERKALLLSTAVVGFVLYSATLGFLSADPYRLGFQPRLLLALLLFVTLAAIAVRPMLALPLVLAVGAFHLRVGPSSNLWDYLIDPPLVAFALGWTTFDTVSRTRAWRQSRTKGANVGEIEVSPDGPAALG